MVDDVHVDRHPLVLGEQVGDADRRNGDRGVGVHCVPTAAAFALERDNGALLLLAFVLPLTKTDAETRTHRWSHPTDHFQRRAAPPAGRPAAAAFRSVAHPAP